MIESVNVILQNKSPRELCLDYRLALVTNVGHEFVETDDYLMAEQYHLQIIQDSYPLNPARLQFCIHFNSKAYCKEILEGRNFRNVELYLTGPIYKTLIGKGILSNLTVETWN